MNGTKNLVDVKNAMRSFPTTNGIFHAVNDISFGIPKGELAAIIGKSGSGKSTLLNILTGIDRLTGGEVYIDGTAVHLLSENSLAEWRGKNVGVVFQFFQLIPTLTILENVMLPMDFCNKFPEKKRLERAYELLKKVGIPEQADKFPSSLSGGQQQRAAIARALANDPPILVADEPTGNLDTQTAESIFSLFRQLTKDGKTVLIVTHETAYLKFFRSIIKLSDGKMVDFIKAGGDL